MSYELPISDTQLSDVAPAQPALRSWKLDVGSLPLLIATLAAAVALYGSVVAGIVRQWFDDTNSAYGLFVAAAAVLVFRRTAPARAVLPTHPNNWGFVVLGAGLLVDIIGTITGDVFILRASIPIVLCGSILAVRGTAHLRKLLAPLALVAVAIPLPAVIVTWLTLPLQLVASRLAAGVLWLAGVPVARDGNLLTLPNITLEVAEACNGMRSVVSLVSVAAVSAAVLGLSARRAILLIAAAVPIAIIGNGLRVAATGMLALSLGDAAVRGTIHELTGVVAFVVMCVTVIALCAATRTRGKPEQGQSGEVRGKVTSATPPLARLAVVASTLVAALLVARVVVVPAAASPPSLDRLGMRLGPWSGVTAPPLDPDVARTLAADRYLHRYYTGPGGAIEMDVAYYSQPRVGANMHSPLNCLPGTGWQMVDVAETDVATSIGRWRVRDTIVERRGARYALVYWFQSNHRVVADEFSARVRLLGDALQRRRTDAGLIRLIMPVKDDAAAQRAVLTSFATILIPEIGARLR